MWQCVTLPYFRGERHFSQGSMLQHEDNTNDRKVLISFVRNPLPGTSLNGTFLPYANILQYLSPCVCEYV